MYQYLARLVATGLMATAITTGPTAPTVTYSFEAHEMADQLSISLDEAQARLDRQPDVMALAGAAAADLGVSFGGIWVDHAHNGVVVVQAVDGVPSDVLTRLATDHHLTGHVTGRAVPFTVAYLSELTHTIGVQGAEASRGAPVQFTVSLRTDLDKIELAEPSSPTRAQADFLAEIRSRYGPALVEKVDDAASVTAGCSGAFCDTPLRGGVGITGCTAGFIVKGTVDGIRRVLTAGHCFPGNPSFTTRNADGVTVRFIDNGIHTSFFGGGPVGLGDYGVFRINNVASENPKSAVFDVTNNQQPITSVAPYAAGTWTGLFFCKRGKVTGENCGMVQADHTFANFGGVSVWPMVVTTHLTCKGDSGGPSFLQTTGFATTTGFASTGIPCGSPSYLQPLQLAMLGLNLSLA